MGIAYAFISTSMSRNNDLDGYWGPGVLYKYSKEHELDELVFDLVSSQKSKNSQHSFASYYQRKLLDLFQRQNIPFEWIKKANLSFKFIASKEYPELDYLGVHFDCILKMECDMGKIYEVSDSGRCRPHDPTREQRRLQY